MDSTYNTLISVVKGRRSCRRFTDRPVGSAILHKLVEAAIWAPTGCNQQEVRFVLITRKPDLDALLKAKKAINPQAAILVYTDTNATYYKGSWNDPHKSRLQYFDAAAAAMNILLAAEALGLGALWVNVSPYWEGAHGETVVDLYRRFDVPNTLKLQGAVFLGYPVAEVDVSTAKWHGRPVMRGDVHDYIVTVPRKTIIMHYQSPTHDNMGSRALSEGLLNLAIERLGDTHWVRLLNEYPLSSLLTRSYLGRDVESALARFERLTDGMLRRLRHAHDRPCDDFGRYFLRSRYHLLPGSRFWRKLTRRFGFRTANPNDIYSIQREIGSLREPASVELDGFTHTEVPSLIIEPRRTFLERGLGRLVPRVWGMRHVEKRLFELARFDTVIYNGNGYLADYYGDALVRRLFELHVAVRLGKEVVACNLSADLKDPVLRALTTHVFRGIPHILTREPLSRAELADYGVEADRIAVAADAAICSSVEPCEDVTGVFDAPVEPGNAIGVILRGDRAHEVEMWAELTGEIRDLTGLDIVLMSSCLKQDKPLMTEIGRRAGFAHMVKRLSHPQFIGLLSQFRLIISDRYHPCVFCIRTQTPVVPLIGNTLKTQGLFTLFPYSLPVLEPRIQETGNRDAAVHAVQEALANEAKLREELAEGYRVLREAAAENIPAFLGESVPRTPTAD